MDDLLSLTPDDLRGRMGAAIARRLEAVSADERAHAADDLLVVLEELRRRGCRAYASHLPSGDGGVLAVPVCVPEHGRTVQVRHLRRERPRPAH